MIGFYRALLRLYPASFRLEYRDELTRAFTERTSGRPWPAALVAALADVVPNAIAAHGAILRQDVGYAVRSLRRTPGFAITAVLVVALGVGANTAVFSIADFSFVRPLPFPQSDELVKLWKGGWGNEVSPANYREWREQTSSYAMMSAWTPLSVNLSGQGDPRRLERVQATPELFPVLGIAPQIGRVFTPEEHVAENVLVLSYGLWQTQFGGDMRVLGKTVQLDGIPHTVIGVMPRSFIYPTRETEAWTPLVFREDDFTDRDNSYLRVIARLKPGVSVEQARRELALVSARLEQQYPRQENADSRGVLLQLRDEVLTRSRMLVLALCGASFCILLLACANLASLFLARGAHRARELAVRAALGAGRERLVRQLVTESVGVAVTGGVIGMLGAVALMPLLSRLIPNTLPIAKQATVDVRVFVLAAVLMLFTGFMFGLAPALKAGRSDAADALRSGTRAGGGRTQRLRAGLVVLEVALSVVLLIASGLLIRAIGRLQATDPGFAPENVLTVQTTLPFPKYDSTARRVQFYDRVLEQVRAIPNVKHAAYVTGLPMWMGGGIRAVTFPGLVPDETHTVSYRFVTPDYFATMGIELRRGRDVQTSDARGQPLVIVVSESFVNRHWPGENPLGRRFTVSGEERTVVGVVGDVRTRGLERRSEPQVYVPYGQAPDVTMNFYSPKHLVLRTAAARPVRELVTRIRAIVTAADPEQPISDVRTMAEVVSGETAPRLTQLRLLGALAAVALLIAGLGIHGLLSFTVAKRSQELGVRRALGAQVESIVGLVMKEGLVLATVGMLIGVAAGYAAARGMTALLFGVRPEDPLTLSLAALSCLLTALLGCLRPALSAARVDPLTALRSE